MHVGWLDRLNYLLRSVSSFFVLRLLRVVLCGCDDLSFLLSTSSSGIWNRALVDKMTLWIGYGVCLWKLEIPWATCLLELNWRRWWRQCVSWVLVCKFDVICAWCLGDAWIWHDAWFVLHEQFFYSCTVGFDMSVCCSMREVGACNRKLSKSVFFNTHACISLHCCLRACYWHGMCSLRDSSRVLLSTASLPQVVLFVTNESYSKRVSNREAGSTSQK